MWSFGAFCDEFYLNTRLFLKLELEPSRETLLHFLEQMRKGYPNLARLRRREDGALVLDEEGAPNAKGRRYLRLDPNALKFGCFNPPDIDTVAGFADLVLAQAPVHLGMSDLDFDYMEVVYGFDLEYRGNHDELVAETLYPDNPLMKVLGADNERVLDCQPFFGVATTQDCETQVYLEIKGRTQTYEVRSGEFEEAAPLSIYLTARRYWSASARYTLPNVFRELVSIGERYAAERVLPNVVQPLAAAIASRR